ncbi:phospholipase D-like domain-containing protein [Massilia sp. SR12]
MSDPIKRTESTHINEVQRTSTSTAQWLLEKANMAGTHPISHNNKLTFMIGGQEAFADIAKHIGRAKESIDICCWGFDPGMELVRDGGKYWPRGETYGDLLIAAGKRGVKVRLLVWYDEIAVKYKNPRNMPGHTHDFEFLYRDPMRGKREINAREALEQTKKEFKRRAAAYNAGRARKFDFDAGMIARAARRRYCMDWYDAAFRTQFNELKNIEVRKFCGDADMIAKNLKQETYQPSNGFAIGAERQVLVRFGTLHQKPILIDFFHNEGSDAVGYIMGLNSLTDYWDTTTHTLDDPNREYEQVVGGADTPGCHHVKPLRDYACRIDGGRALLSIYHNFINAWGPGAQSQPIVGANGKERRPTMPEACLRKAKPGDSTVQIVRTHPTDGDCSIRDVYFLAADQATHATGYLYLENQYFQYTEWAQRLMKKRKSVMEDWTAVCGGCSKTARDMPLMHVFIVIPLPEQEGMIPRTYDTLATLGQQEGMKGQSKMISSFNQLPPAKLHLGIGKTITLPHVLPPVVNNANRIKKPDEKMLEKSYGLKVCTATLNACDFVDGKWRYREIYIHSKLLLVDDTFITMGSANLNQRSMAVDCEINLATIAPDKASELRRQIWGQLSGNQITGGGGSRADIADAFRLWKEQMKQNAKDKSKGNQICSLLVPLEDGRSSLVCLG